MNSFIKITKKLASTELPRAFSFEEFFDKRIEDYYDTLMEATQGNLKPFIVFYLECVNASLTKVAKDMPKRCLNGLAGWKMGRFSVDNYLIIHWIPRPQVLRRIYCLCRRLVPYLSPTAEAAGPSFASTAPFWRSGYFCKSFRCVLEVFWE
ncbi:hypothetical protein [Paenibacillus sp. FSL R7-277]|uniref:hypothetical protein n=1 Tax=Paenibacillus sp. FSL R7-277 TaxID=1227352 RepID=UPI001F45A6AE|nr:hypothetical protein [Paenibacillus sp. FSL R7-277]